ncbi:MAG TPA: MBL fold metallo-hydrolase [Clostridiaceae bacterium]|nr:MBL fold metallo-hydrolase [Clostridiaceae bacterium]
MKISFLGATKTVTGSCFYVETGDSRFLVDCGLFQGQSVEEELNNEAFPFNPADLEYVILTHAHIDHSGKIPKLFVDGFRGKVIATKATTELCAIMLPDSGYIQESEAEWKNRKRLRAGDEPVKPLYTMNDAVECMKLFQKVKYDEIVSLTPNIKFRFRDAGHILGSSILELWVRENGKENKIVFSGDLGNKGIPILRDPDIIEEADFLIIESTYGNKLHQDNDNKFERFIDIINDTIKKGGNIIIPSFAVGRTQEIIYELNKHKEKYENRLSAIYNIPVFIDSPLAISATEVFRNNLDCYDEEAREYIENGDNPLDFHRLYFTRTAEESKALNNLNESAIIISASGMCEAGRIKHHLKHNLWRRDSAVIFVGYQAQGTLGRKISDGAKKVKIFGEEITVNARIEMIDGFSGHADQKGLIDWIGSFKYKPGKIFIVHGEEDSSKELARLIEENFRIETVIPGRNETFVIKGGRVAEDIEDYTAINKYKRLEVISMLESLREDFDELSGILKSNLMKGLNDSEVEALRLKLAKLDSFIINVLR